MNVCGILMSWLFLILVIVFRIYLRYVEFTDYMFCYACRELDTIHKSYDYIVVGLGTAGSIVARRLSEDGRTSVLALEAGSYSTSLMQIPGIALLLQKSSYDWQYRTVPQEYGCKALENNASTWPMGKIVGGTHMFNNMIYTRGYPGDYDYWNQSDEHYKYEDDILPYFKKLENHIKTVDSDKRKGSVIISDAPFLSSLTEYILAAVEFLGFPVLLDHITATYGFSKPKVTVYNGMRWTTADHLLNLQKPNLVIRSQTTVEKILFRDNYEAKVLKYLYLNDYYYAKAKKGIILCAGVVGSPKILMLSGIGPQEHLETINIRPKINLPVGDNLQDHVTTGLDLVRLENITLDTGLNALMNPVSIYNYFFKKSGPLATVGCDVLGFISHEYLNSAPLKDSDNEQPSLQFMFMPQGVSLDKGVVLYRLVDIKRNVWNNYFQHLNDDSVLSILPVLLHPKSRGTVRLKDKNVYSQPVINPNYLQNPYDIDVLVEGINFIKEIIDTEPMQKVGATLYNRLFPGCEDLPFDSKDYWRCYIQHLTLTTFHPVGTCKMGIDSTSVVDFNFKVKGTNNLYVVDGSVLPNLISGNINGAIMMLAEKASDAIKYQNFLNSSHCRIIEIFIQKQICDNNFEHMKK